MKSGTLHTTCFPLLSNRCQTCGCGEPWANLVLYRINQTFFAPPHYHFRSEFFANMSASQPDNTQGDSGRSPNSDSLLVSTKACIFAHSPNLVFITRKQRLVQSLRMATIPMSSNMHLQSQKVIYGKFSSNPN
jgi:hypothetical protein